MFEIHEFNRKRSEFGKLKSQIEEKHDELSYNKETFQEEKNHEIDQRKRTIDIEEKAIETGYRQSEQRKAEAQGSESTC